MISAFVGECRARETEIHGDRAFEVIEGCNSVRPRFDSIGIFSKEVHELYADLVTARLSVLVVFPMARCEFSGDESVKMINAMRRDFICTLDWNRTPAPKILMAMENTHTESRTRGKGRQLALLSTLQREVALLSGAPGSWLEVENYRHAVCCFSASSDSDQIDVRTKVEIVHVDADEAVKAATSFVSVGDTEETFVAQGSGRDAN
jgi:hypothetical protein